jgi:hypothetical protein
MVAMKSADAQAAAQRAEEAARAARAVQEHPGIQASLTRLEAFYTHQFKTSEPKDVEARESAYFMLRALDALRQDIAAAAQGAEITRRNLRSRLNTKP